VAENHRCCPARTYLNVKRKISVLGSSGGNAEIANFVSVPAYSFISPGAQPNSRANNMLLTLAVGIGANTAIFSVLDASFLGLSPTPNPTSLSASERQHLAWEWRT
jgi:hypothetical protein